MAAGIEAQSLPRVSVEHIVLDERGVARLAGRRTKVIQIVMDRLAFGWGAEEIAAQYPHLTPAEIHAALAYYYDHQEEIERQIAASQELADELRARTENAALASKIRATNLPS